MKEELLVRIKYMHESVIELNKYWNTLNWDETPDVVAESYPFYQDLDCLEQSIENWLRIIEKS